MSIVAADISISLDGYIAAAGRTPDEPMGPGGERLHERMASEEGQRLLGQSIAGAVSDG